jgi:translation initiation factor IF-3
MNSKKTPKVNHEISAQIVRLLDENGDMMGEFPLREALRIAGMKELDLIESSPNANPPLCRLGNMGKIKYEQQKKESKERKRNKAIEIKEVKFTLNIAQNDFEVKINHIRKFIENLHTVKVSCIVKGRDKAYSKERLPPLFDKIISELSDIALVNGKPSILDHHGDLSLVPKMKNKA